MKALLIVLAVIAVVAVGFVVFPHDMAAIEVKAEPIGLGKHLTNAVVTSFVLSAALAVFAFFFGRRLKERPGGLQNVVEGLIEGLDNLVRDVRPQALGGDLLPDRRHHFPLPARRQHVQPAHPVSGGGPGLRTRRTRAASIPVPRGSPASRACCSSAESSTT